MSDANAEKDGAKYKAMEPLNLTDEATRCPMCGSEDYDSEEVLFSSEDGHCELFWCQACGRRFVVNSCFSFYVESAHGYPTVKCPRCKKMGAVFIDGLLYCYRCTYNEEEQMRRHGRVSSREGA